MCHNRLFHVAAVVIMGPGHGVAQVAMPSYPPTHPEPWFLCMCECGIFRNFGEVITLQRVIDVMEDAHR